MTADAAAPGCGMLAEYTISCYNTNQSLRLNGRDLERVDCTPRSLTDISERDFAVMPAFDHSNTSPEQDNSNDPKPEFDTPRYQYELPTIYPPILAQFVKKSRSLCADLASIQYWPPFSILSFAYDCQHWRATFSEYLTTDDAQVMDLALDVATDELSRRNSLVGAEAPKVSGYVYLLSSEVGYYKIGCSTKPDNRLRTFGVQLPFRVECMCTIYSRDMYGLEHKLHDKFAEYRANGEWFKLPNDAVDYIKGLQK